MANSVPQFQNGLTQNKCELVKTRPPLCQISSCAPMFGEDGNSHNFSRLLVDCRKQAQTSKQRPGSTASRQHFPTGSHFPTNFTEAFTLHLERCVRRRTSDDKIEMMTKKGPVILSKTESARHLAPYAQTLFESDGGNSKHRSFYNYIARHTPSRSLRNLQHRPRVDRSKWAQGHQQPPRTPSLDPAPRGVALIFARDTGSGKSSLVPSLPSVPESLC